jgi:hypothetical protein
MENIQAFTGQESCCPFQVQYFNSVLGNDHDKGKAIPLQTLTGPEGSRRFRLPDFKTIGT